MTRDEASSEFGGGFDLSPEGSSAFVEEHDMQQHDVEQRLAELAQLSAGWMDGQGAPIHPDAIALLGEVLRGAKERGLEPPYVYPTLAGGVQAEWSFPGAEVSAELGAGSSRVSCMGVHIESRVMSEREIDLREENAITELVDFVGGFRPPGAAGSSGSQK